MKIYVHLAPLFLSTLVLGVSAATREYDLKIEKQNVSPDGQEQFYWPQVHSDQ